MYYNACEVAFVLKFLEHVVGNETASHASISLGVIVQSLDLSLGMGYHLFLPNIMHIPVACHPARRLD